MKKIINFIKVNFFTLVLILTMAFSQNWAAMLISFCLLISELQTDLWRKYSKTLDEERDKWYRMYISEKYPNLNIN